MVTARRGGRQASRREITNGLKSIQQSGDWAGVFTRWHEHRDRTYKFSMADIGRNWDGFNPEQQASIVESWWVTEADRGPHDFGEGVRGGGASPADPRFPYIRDVIRARNRHAGYVPLVAVPGADPAIRAIQDKLVELGHLHERHADGVVGNSRSPTLDAVRTFPRTQRL